MGFIHGGRLDGTEVSSFVKDWSFTDPVKTIQLETAPDDPYSVNVWCVAKDANLWVTASSQDSAWAKNMIADPRVRVRVGDKLYPRRAVRVTDPLEAKLVRTLYEKKYETDRESDAGLQFRLDPP